MAQKLSADANAEAGIRARFIFLKEKPFQNSLFDVTDEIFFIITDKLSCLPLRLQTTFVIFWNIFTLGELQQIWQHASDSRCHSTFLKSVHYFTDS